MSAPVYVLYVADSLRHLATGIICCRLAKEEKGQKQ